MDWVEWFQLGIKSQIRMLFSKSSAQVDCQRSDFKTPKPGLPVPPRPSSNNLLEISQSKSSEQYNIPCSFSLWITLRQRRWKLSDDQCSLCAYMKWQILFQVFEGQKLSAQILRNYTAFQKQLYLSRDLCFQK